MDCANTPTESYNHNDTKSGTQDLENVKPPDLQPISYMCDSQETMSSSDDSVHLEECNKTNQENNTATKAKILCDSFEHQESNENAHHYQDHYMLNSKLESLNHLNMNSDNNMTGNTLVRTNTNECAISIAKTISGSSIFGTNQMVANELYSDDGSNKELLKLLVEPNLKQSEFLLGNTNVLSNPDVAKCINSSSEEPILRNVSEALSQNSSPSVRNVVNNNIASLAQLDVYESDGEEFANEASNVVVLQYREDKNDKESDEGSDSDSSSSSSCASKIISDTDTESDEEYENYKSVKPHKSIKAKGELELEDLPPIEDLQISVPKEDCIPVGKVYQIVDQLVVVEALKGVPAYDLETVLFLEEGQPLGKVFDVFGPVAEPYYCVRFNSRDHIKEKNIHLNQTIYSAPNTKHTKYVFLKQLMRLKGSDASWVDDDEPPEGCLEYSDDEQEQRAKKKKCRSGKATLNVESDPDEPARKKHFAYEERMNARNLQLSATRRNPYSNKNKSQHFKNNLWSTSSTSQGLSNMTRPPEFQNVPHHIFGRPPLFNKTALPFPPPFRSAVPFQDRSQSNFVQNSQPSLANTNSSSPFPQQISHWRPPQCFNTGEPSNFEKKLSCLSPSNYIHRSVNSNLRGFNPNSSNWMSSFSPMGSPSINSPPPSLRGPVPPLGTPSMNTPPPPLCGSAQQLMGTISTNSPPPPLRSPVVPNNSFSSPLWTAQTNKCFPNSNNQTPRCSFPRNSVQHSFPISKPFRSVHPSLSSIPKNPFGPRFNPNIPPPRPYVNSLDIFPNISSRGAFNSNIPPPPPLPTYGPISTPTNTSAELINFNLNIPPPSQNPNNQ